ncbi:MAG: PilZ domain-containing protein [Acidobacteriota bacterium]
MADDRLIFICEGGEGELSLEKRLLSIDGYHALAVPEGDLLDAVKSYQPCLVVLGLLPRNVPLLLTRRLREDPLTKKTSVLATAVRGALVRDEILSRGVNQVLFRPFPPEKFLQEVERLTHIPTRHKVRLPLRMKRQRDQRWLKGSTLNISEAGILVYSERTLEIGETFVLEVSAPSGGFTLSAEVVRIAAEMGPGHYGLAFRHPRDVLEQAIRVFGLRTDGEEPDR